MPDPRARSFGTVALDYERGRPGWPPGIAAVGGLEPSAEVLDLGAGTGKLTRVLADRFARVVAVEPDDAMRALIDCAEALPGSAEAIPLPDASVDGVFCAEAFHWFDGPLALAEIERVLRPGGALVLCWNRSGVIPEQDWEVVRRYWPSGGEAGGSIYESGVWREAFADSHFEELHEESFSYEHVVDRERAIAGTLSVSVLALLPEEERRALAAELRDVQPDGESRTTCRIDVHWARLRAG